MADLTKVKQLLAAAQKEFNIVQEVKIDREDKFKLDGVRTQTEVIIADKLRNGPVDTVSERIRQDKEHLAASKHPLDSLPEKNKQKDSEPAPDSEAELRNKHIPTPRPR